MTTAHLCGHHLLLDDLVHTKHGHVAQALPPQRGTKALEQTQGATLVTQHLARNICSWVDRIHAQHKVSVAVSIVVCQLQKICGHPAHSINTQRHRAPETSLGTVYLGPLPLSKSCYYCVPLGPRYITCLAGSSPASSSRWMAVFEHPCACSLHLSSSVGVATRLTAIEAPTAATSWSDNVSAVPAFGRDRHMHTKQAGACAG